MKTCKKLFSLLLVAVMLVAAIPFAAMATPLGTDHPGPFKIVAKCNGEVIKENTWEDTFVAAFEPDTKTGAEYVLNGAPGADYEYVDSALVGNTLTVNYKISSTHTHTEKVTGAGDASGHTIGCTLKGCTYSKVVAHATSGEAATAIQEKAATCTTDGIKAGTRYECGFVVGGDVVPALGHKFKNGKCEVCNAPDPSATTPGTGSGSGTTTPGGSTGSTPSTSTKKTINVVVDGTKTIYTEKNYTGAVDAAHAQDILTAAGSSVSLSNYDVVDVKGNGDEITVTLTKKAYAGYTLNLTVYAANGTSSTTKYQNVSSFSGNTSDVSAVLTAFNVTGYDLVNGYDVTKNTYDNSTKTFEIVLAAKPTAANKYTVNCIVNGVQFATKSNVSYVGSFESNVANAQAILNAAGIQKNANEFKKVTITKSNTGVITVDLRNTIVVRVYNNANSYSEVTMDVGQPYVNYLGTNLINNSTFGGITVKDTSDRNTYYSASAVNGSTALVSAFDKEITIQRNGDSCTLYFLRSDGTVLESRKLYAGDQIGTLPSYIVGNVPAVWTYNGKPISATDVYNFKTTSVNIVPYFGGISDVYVDVYTNGNVKTMQTRVKVTDLVQNGVLYLNSEVKSSISSALRNTSNKNLTYTAFFDASSWSDFIKTKNTNGAAEPIRVGDNSERQGAVYLYVMVNNVTQKAADSTNPKTGDDVKLGVAAAVLAVAVVGFGAAIVIKKKKGVQ